MERAHLVSWVQAYERLWRTAGTDLLAELFTADVSYAPSPWAQPVRGLAALEQFWDAEREGPDERFTLGVEVVALDGATGVVRAEVDYASGDSWLDLWIIVFDDEGRCTSFEEWPLASPP